MLNTGKNSQHYPVEKAYKLMFNSSMTTLAKPCETSHFTSKKGDRILPVRKNAYTCKSLNFQNLMSSQDAIAHIKSIKTCLEKSQIQWTPINTDTKRTMQKCLYYPDVCIKWALRINVTDKYFTNTRTKVYNLQQTNILTSLHFKVKKPYAHSNT